MLKGSKNSFQIVKSCLTRLGHDQAQIGAGAGRDYRATNARRPVDDHQWGVRVFRQQTSLLLHQCHELSAIFPARIELGGRRGPYGVSDETISLMLDESYNRAARACVNASRAAFASNWIDPINLRVETIG